MIRRCGILLLVLSLLTGTLLAQATLYVDDDAPGDPGPGDRQVSDPDEDGSADHPFDGVQEAVHAATDGDTVIVGPGHYLSPDPWEYEEVNFDGKNIRLVSSAPTDFSVIEQTVLCGVVVFHGTEEPDCLLQGFKIQSIGHGGILGNGTRATISHCVISGNGPCSATVVKDARGRIANCLIVDNTTVYYCGVMPVISGCPELVNCTIANNASGVGIEGAESSILTVIRNCIIYGNQGPQIVSRSSIHIRPFCDLTYSLVQGWTGWDGDGGGSATNVDADPCFVQPGYWTQGAPFVLVEGDYHLKSEGWRWSEREMHGSHWWFDLSTSPAVDAGDPMDSLGEELERVPDDPEGQWGVNRAIDMGAYGGTTQGSLSPTKGGTPGIGAVDLRDYWPFATDNEWSTNYGRSGQWRSVRVVQPLDANGFEAHSVLISSTSSQNWAYCVFVNGGLYVSGDVAPLSLLPQIVEPLEWRYPQFLTVGSTMLVPDDPFAAGSISQPVTVVRGSLSEVHAGAAYDSTEYVRGLWQDVVAFRPHGRDGTLAGPIAIFARGFGPLMLNGQSVDKARVDGKDYEPDHRR